MLTYPVIIIVHNVIRDVIPDFSSLLALWFHFYLVTFLLFCAVDLYISKLCNERGSCWEVPVHCYTYSCQVFNQKMKSVKYSNIVIMYCAIFCFFLIFEGDVLRTKYNNEGFSSWLNYVKCIQKFALLKMLWCTDHNL